MQTSGRGRARDRGLQGEVIFHDQLLCAYESYKRARPGPAAPMVRGVPSPGLRPRWSVGEGARACGPDGLRGREPSVIIRVWARDSRA